MLNAAQIPISNWSTRSRIVLLVVLAALPALALTIYVTLAQGARIEARERDDLRGLVNLAAGEQRQIVEGARQLLVATSEMLPDWQRDPGRCNAYFANLMIKSPGLFHSMGLHDTKGRIVCHSNPFNATIDASDRPYFRSAMASGQFSIGEYQIGRVTGLQGINFGYPVKDRAGKVTGVAFVGLDLGALNRIAAITRLPENGILSVTDRNGTQLVRQPEISGRIGQKIPNPQALEAALAGTKWPIEIKGIDGLDRLYAYQTIATNPDGSAALRLGITIPLYVLRADVRRALINGLAGIGIITVLLLACAWFGADLFVLKHIRTLLETANRVRAGDLSARTGLRYGKEELSQLGQAFDEMAQALQQRQLELDRALLDLQEQAITDPLTGLYNRRYLSEFLPRELARTERKGAPVAFIMVDIDHFKRVNDNYGHDAGDQVLREIADLLGKNVRGGDIACRYGGEEFALILHEAGAETAQRRAEDIRAAIKRLDPTYAGKRIGGITASFGIALFPDHAEDSVALVRAADEAMYQAKRGGRDRVVIKAAVPQAPHPAGSVKDRRRIV